LLCRVTAGLAQGTRRSPDGGQSNKNKKAAKEKRFSLAAFLFLLWG